MLKHQMVFLKIEIKNFHIINEILNKHHKIKKIFDYKLKNYLMYLKLMHYYLKNFFFQIKNGNMYQKKSYKIK